MKSRPIISTALTGACVFLIILITLPGALARGDNTAPSRQQPVADQPKMDPMRPAGQSPKPNPTRQKSAPPAAPAGRNAPKATPTPKDRARDAGTLTDDPDAEGQNASPADRASANERSATPTPSPAASRPAEDESWWEYILEPTLWVLGVIVVLLMLGLLSYGIKIFVDGRRQKLEAKFASIRERQDDYAKQSHGALVKFSKSVTARMDELQSEIRGLRRSLEEDRAILDGVRRSGSAATAYAGYSGYASSSPRVEEPPFPVAAEEYLNKVRRDAVYVKPDFQNGILVQDADGGGEFVLVRDHTAPDELLYVVPRVGYFQTKQDFYNYYDKYYDCQRPSAGTVWVVAPAVVDRVSGGWKLRERGELEVR